MKEDTSKELEMQKEEALHPDTAEELAAYIESLAEMEHDYGTCVYAVSLASVATFNYMARKLGITGFQAQCADMDILNRTRSMKGPFAIVDAAKMLYPQYDLRRDLHGWLSEWNEWAAGECAKLLREDTGACDSVRQHWERLAASVKP